MLKDAATKDLESLLNVSYKIYNNYQWLIDAYISDFYLEHHWDNLPNSWKQYLDNLEPEEIACLINVNKNLELRRKVAPLSLIVLRKCLKLFVVPRHQQLSITDAICNKNVLNENLFLDNRFNKFFWKCIKLKKKHEIELMSKLCYKLALETNCLCIIDVGSGLGHLSRLLSYRYGLRVCSLESQDSLSEKARKLDKDVENTLRKYNLNMNMKLYRPTHVNMKVNTSDLGGEDILEVAEEVFGSLSQQNLKFGIVGLHPCGNLGTTLLHLFANFPQVQFINIVGCCYMKLTTNSLSCGGFPLSKYCQGNHFNLSYSSRETACHALELYLQKLNREQLWELKVHAFRASLEKLIVNKWPEMKHSQICNVKYSENLTFSDYCVKALSKFSFKLSEEEQKSEEIVKDLLAWKSVVAFYSLRLMLAPIIETIILLDRLLMVKEKGYGCYITSLFDPELSPRNQVLTAIKTTM